MAARRVLMVEPVGFRSNPETAADNAFQEPVPEGEEAAVAEKAQDEFDRLREALEERGVEVEVLAPADASTPDAVFPNNWFTTRDGTLILYPMRSPARRRERRPEFVESLKERYPEVVDLSAEEGMGRFLEGTGSLVIDEGAKRVYAAASARTDPGLVERWAKRFGYEPVMFAAFDRDGIEIYHTNVVMSVGERWAVSCGEAIAETVDRSEVLASLFETGHETFEISLEQMHDFCGNVLEVENGEGEKLIVMSERAYEAYTPEQRAVLERHAGIVHVDLSTIERHGGGSARCMLAELN
ncbi:MAG: arginine deiminase-related protein [Gemmatimonadota bacterium]|nr:arginine deiminase-related protein [Gemmatimonadota bacterium]